MQVTYRGLALEQACDMIFDTLVPDYWFVAHKGSGRTVLIIEASSDKAQNITTELSNLRDWEHTDEWEDDVGLAVFVAKYPGEVELPSYDDDRADDDVFWDDIEGDALYGPELQ